MNRTRVTIDLDLPENIILREYHRQADGHGFLVEWPLPPHCRCNRCGHDDQARIEFKNTFYTVRDLNVWGQPSFWLYRPPQHHCSRCGHRQHLIPPFKRKDTSYTYRFEHWVLQSLMGSTEEEVAGRLGISAEMVHHIVENQLNDIQAKRVDPRRVVQDIGMDEISLKKRHKLYATLLTDLTDPAHPRLLAMAAGRDRVAAEACLNRLSEPQRRQVQTYRTDMSSAFLGACEDLLPNARSVIDRFHVARKLGEVADTLRKKITRAYKKTLPKEQLKAFRSQMWSFRRRPEDLTEKAQANLQQLFEEVPLLGAIYYARWELTNIFDHAPDRETAARQIDDWIALVRESDMDWEPFVEMYERHQEGILNYFTEGKTSGPVEGLNNKVRVVLKRTYGMKSVGNLWSRLVLEVNHIGKQLGHTITTLRELAHQFRAVFCWAYT